MSEFDKELRSDLLKSQRMEVEEAEARTRLLLEKQRKERQESGRKSFGDRNERGFREIEISTGSNPA